MVHVSFFCQLPFFVSPDVILCGWLGLKHQPTNSLPFLPPLTFSETTKLYTSQLNPHWCLSCQFQHCPFSRLSLSCENCWGHVCVHAVPAPQNLHSTQSTRIRMLCECLHSTHTWMLKQCFYIAEECQDCIDQVLHGALAHWTFWHF